MSELYREQHITSVAAGDLLEKAMDLKAEGYRLGQICCTNVADGFELLYSFDKDHTLLNLKVTLSFDDEMISITGPYWPAFVYENEVRDLFGITFKHNALDFGGHFFRVSKPTPWRPETAAAASSAPEVQD